MRLYNQCSAVLIHDADDETLAPTAVFCTTPGVNGVGGGVWGSAAKLAIDNDGEEWIAAE
jgi:hypothetical protein